MKSEKLSWLLNSKSKILFSQLLAARRKQLLKVGDLCMLHRYVDMDHHYHTVRIKNPLFLLILNIAPEPPPSKPHFISRLEPEMTIPHGEPLHLKCKVGGYPLPKTTWYIDGTPLKNVPPYEITTRGGETSLKVPQTEEGDGGVYSCLATNPSGQDSTSSNVTVEGRLSKLWQLGILIQFYFHHYFYSVLLSRFTSVCRTQNLEL